MARILLKNGHSRNLWMLTRTEKRKLVHTDCTRWLYNPHFYYIVCSVHHRGDGQAAARPHGGRGGVGGRLIDDGHVGNLRGTDGAVIIHGRRGRRPVRRWPAARHASNDKPAAPASYQAMQVQRVLARGTGRAANHFNITRRAMLFYARALSGSACADGSISA